MSRRAIGGALVALLFLCAMPDRAPAQVFIASRPQPEFTIGPLFVSASVRNKDVAGAPGPLTVTVAWSLSLPPRRSAS